MGPTSKEKKIKVKNQSMQRRGQNGGVVGERFFKIFLY